MTTQALALASCGHKQPKALLAHLAMEIYYTAIVCMWAALAFTACP